MTDGIEKSRISPWAMPRYRRRRDEPVRVAVVGVGGMGRNHARVLAQLKGVELAAVVDADFDRAHEVAAAFDCRALSSIGELPDVDAAVIAVPSVLHAEVGCALLAQGIHCLIEKPLAPTRLESEQLIAAAKRSGALLQVGHIERFNPAVRLLREIIADDPILVVNARRMSAVSGRIRDVDVVVDLMVHDLDIVLFMMGHDLTGIVARGVDGEFGPDHVTALVSFAGNRMASLTASRVTQNQIRHLEVTTHDRFFTVDYPNQELQIFRQGRIGGLTGTPGEDRYVLDVGTERVFVRRLEPLVEELSHFVSAVRGEHAPEVDGPAALAALELVWEIQSQLVPAVRA